MKFEVVIAVVTIIVSSCQNNNDIKSNAVNYFKRASNIHSRNLDNEDSISYAILLLDTAIQLDNVNSKFLFSRAQMAMEIKKYDLVINSSNKILIIEKNNFMALLLKGIAFELSEETDSASSNFKFALKSLQTTNFKSFIFKEYQRVILYGLLKDTINFKQRLNYFKEEFNKKEEFSTYYDELVHFNRNDYLNSYH